MSLPEHRRVFPGDGVVQQRRMKIGHGSVLQPTASVLLTQNLLWSVDIYGEFQLLASSLSSFPLISSPAITSNLLCR